MKRRDPWPIYVLLAACFAVLLGPIGVLLIGACYFWRRA